ncbi:hypothetical protein H8N00_12610 [Streptomyces sp. AC563]|uniref:hypothetical protein n=1 Tax=Streptomyces buecherae TaxID=2763006 RepID=UPI00164EB1C6|nr:hypothetical protein [Streptomyces buecherae]MBC3989700.1 hypothetical protein [Streptomyces buecherae]
MAASLPRVECPSCGGRYAAHPISALGMGAVHDHKVRPRDLVLCPGSMQRVPLRDATAWQDPLPGTQDTDPREQQLDLFDDAPGDSRT